MKDCRFVVPMSKLFTSRADALAGESLSLDSLLRVGVIGIWYAEISCCCVTWCYETTGSSRLTRPANLTHFFPTHGLGSRDTCHRSTNRIPLL